MIVVAGVDTDLGEAEVDGEGLDRAENIHSQNDGGASCESPDSEDAEVTEYQADAADLDRPQIDRRGELQLTDAHLVGRAVYIGGKVFALALFFGKELSVERKIA